MIRTYPIYMETALFFGKMYLFRLAGRIDFDDRGLKDSEGEPVVYNVALRLEGDLLRWQATLSAEAHRFEGSQTFRFEVRVPLNEELAAAGTLDGTIILWDIDRDCEIDRLRVRIAKIVSLPTVEGNNRWELDHGNSSGAVGCEQPGPDGPTFLPCGDMPVPARLRLTAGEPGGPPSLEVHDPADEGPMDVVVTGPRRFLGRAESGPADPFPHTGVDLNVFYLGALLKRALLHAQAVPRYLCVTVPANYGPHQVDHYLDVLRRAAREVGLPEPEMKVIDEATEGLVGVFQELLESLGGPALAHLLNSGEPFHVVGIDMGASTTDFSKARVVVSRQGNRYVAVVKLEAVYGLPVGGDAYSRLVLLCQLARLLRAADNSASTDVTLLAEGHVEDFDDPHLMDLDKPRTLRLLEELSAFLPPENDDDPVVARTTRHVVLQAAEQLKVRLNTPLDDDPTSYPPKVELDEAATEGWRWLSDYHGLKNPDEAAALNEETLSRLYAPALRELVAAVAGLARLNDGPLHALTLTCNGCRLRALKSLRANALLEQLADDLFDRHPRRLFHAEELKLVVCRGAHAIFHDAAQKRSLEWRYAGLFDVLPYDLGRVNADNTFEVLVPRGTKLPFEMTPPNRPRDLTLYERAFPGARLAPAGTLLFEPVDKGADPKIKIDIERRIKNQDDLPITPLATIAGRAESGFWSLGGGSGRYW